jgi:hypothetical protein
MPVNFGIYSYFLILWDSVYWRKWVGGGGGLNAVTDGRQCISAKTANFRAIETAKYQTDRSTFSLDTCNRPHLCSV